MTIGCEHLIAAVHGADRRLHHTTAGVAKALAGREQGLLTNHTLAMYFLHLAVAVGDDPVTADQLRGLAAGVADGDVIGEDVVFVFGV